MSIFALLQASLLAKDALRRVVMTIQSSLHDADLAKQAQQHMDCMSSSQQDSRQDTRHASLP